jgi:diguanylate cyclase (GGDEF)-like protein
MAAIESSMRVLLVDDAQVERLQLQLRLKKLGYEVEVAASGREALEMYQDFDPELVLLDITMPEMDGFQVAMKIRQCFKDWIPIIFLSGHDDPEMIAQAIAVGGDDYLVKPVNKIVLQSKLTAMQRIALMRRELKQTSAELELLNKTLQHQANEDGLTKLFNRRFMDNKLEELIKWHGRHQTSMTVILLDVDHFNAYNDNYGHSAGDDCLIKIANTLDNMFSRSGEYVGRYGGEEFVIAFSQSGIKSAEANAKRIVAKMIELSIPHEYSDTRQYVTVSLVVFCYTPYGDEALSSVYRAADQRLYAAKHNGRDCYVIELPVD